MISESQNLVEKATDGSRWPRKDLLLKMMEELGELAQANNRNRGSTEEETGDLLFALLAFCVDQKINSQKALQGAIDKHLATIGTPRAATPNA